MHCILMLCYRQKGCSTWPASLSSPAGRASGLTSKKHHSTRCEWICGPPHTCSWHDQQVYRLIKNSLIMVSLIIGSLIIFSLIIANQLIQPDRQVNSLIPGLQPDHGQPPGLRADQGYLPQYSSSGRPQAPSCGKPL